MTPWPPLIWRASERTMIRERGDIHTRHDEVVYDETPGYVGCSVRSWYGDGYVEWGYVSRRYEKTDADGGWAVLGNPGDEA